MRSSPFFLAAAILLGVSCGYDEVPGPADDGTPPDPKDSLDFVPQTPLQLAPGATAILAVQISPPRSTSVLFGIIGDSKNEAYLATEVSQTDANGKAYVSLTGPKTPGAFRVRAAVTGGPTAERAVSVSGQGFGTLLVTPNYTGTREPTEWVASAWPDLLCSSLVSDYPTGPTEVRGSSPLSLGPLPVGPTLAIVVRSGNLAAGCLDVPALTPDTVLPITVNVADLPVISTSTLATKMTFSDVEDRFIAHLRTAVETRLEEATDVQDEVHLFLDSLRKAVPKANRELFDLASEERDGLEPVLLDFLGPDGRVRSVFRSHLAYAATHLSEDSAILASFDPRAEQPDIDVSEVAGVPAKACGFESEGPWSMVTEADGSFVLSGDLVFNAVPWLAGIAEARAVAEAAALSVWLGRDFSCEALGALLAPPDQNLYEECDEACAQALCEKALELLWRSWLETDEAQSVLSVAASGVIESGPSGVLLKLSGSWIGSMEDEDSVIGGDFAASAP